MIQDAIRQAQIIHRRLIADTYNGSFCAYKYSKKRNEDTKLMESTETEYLSDISCHLSFETVTAAGEGNGAATVSQSVTLFCVPDINIKPGSKLLVRQNGIATIYKQSGVPAVYSSHQEVPLELFKERA